MLVQCLYASRAAVALAPATLDSILQQSRANNPARGITGLLCVTGDIFIQVLEGGRDPVNELYNTLVADSRHSGMRLLSYAEIAQRRFGTWAMGQVDLAKVNAGMLLKYQERAELDPFRCSGATTLTILEELVATASIVNRGPCSGS